jgi:hypothetical protein
VPGDDTPAALAGTITLIATGRNGGYAFGNNVGIRHALRDPAIRYVWILNNDTVVTREALRALVACMEAAPDIGLCGATVLYLERPDRVQALGGGRFLPMRARAEQIGTDLAADAPIDAARIEAQLSYINGAATLARREMIERVGPMDEDYFLYWEEMDWATRMRAAGRYRLGFCADAVVYHRVGAATGTSDHALPSLSSTYWMTRSKFRYLRRHRPHLLAIAYPLLAKAALGEVRAGRHGRARVMLRAAFGLSAP